MRLLVRVAFCLLVLALIGYVCYGGTRVVAGKPLHDDSEWRESFCQRADSLERKIDALGR